MYLAVQGLLCTQGLGSLLWHAGLLLQHVRSSSLTRIKPWACAWRAQS